MCTEAVTHSARRRLLAGLGLAYLAVLTAGFRRPVRLVDFSEAGESERMTW